MKQAEIFVYGAKQICASCVGMPSAEETYEWLEAALTRKFPKQPFTITYIDIENPPEVDHIKEIAQKVLDDEYFYPLVVMDDEILGEGNPRLKTVAAAMEKLGYRQPEQ